MHKISLLKRSVQRILFYRLSLTIFLIALVFSGIAYYHANGMITSAVIQASTIQMDITRSRFLELIKRPGAEMNTVLQDAINYPPGGNTHTKNGEFVYALLHTKDHSSVGTYEHDAYPDLPLIKQYVARTSATLSAQKYPEFKSVSINNKPYLTISSRLMQNDKGTTIFIRAIFALSDESIHKVHSQTLQAVLSVIGIIVTTTLFIYPVITHLINKLADSSTGLLSAHLETMEALGATIAKRDSATNNHNYRVTVYAVRLAEQLQPGAVEMRSLIKGSFLHDIGKIGIRDNILLNKAQLSKEEFAIMKKHVQYGLEIIQGSSWLQDAQDVVGSHHEKFDGSGYPKGLLATDIPINARIFAIVDVFDALTSKRPYKSPFSYEKTMTIMAQGKAKHFDPELLGIFTGIAKELYDSYAGNEEQGMKDTLQQINDLYFHSDFNTLQY